MGKEIKLVRCELTQSGYCEVGDRSGACGKATKKKKPCNIAFGWVSDNATLDTNPGDEIKIVADGNSVKAFFGRRLLRSVTNGKKYPSY